GGGGAVLGIDAEQPEGPGTPLEAVLGQDLDPGAQRCEGFCGIMPGAQALELFDPVRHGLQPVMAYPQQEGEADDGRAAGERDGEREFHPLRAQEADRQDAEGQQEADRRDGAAESTGVLRMGFLAHARQMVCRRRSCDPVTERERFNTTGQQEMTTASPATHRGHHQPAPDPWIVSWLERLAAGSRVLDFACGSGRHARAAAALGLEVVAVDHDAEALAAVGTGVHVVHAELEVAPWPFAAASFDAVIVSNYLFRSRLDLLCGLIRPTGVLLYQTFALGNE